MSKQKLSLGSLLIKTRSVGRGKERKKGSKYKVCNFYRFIPGIKLGIEGKGKRKRKKKGKGKEKRAQI